jgi:hypothetical protein
LSKIAKTPNASISRTDLDFALHYGTPSCFYRDRISEVTITLAAEDSFMSLDQSELESRFSNLHPLLRKILGDVRSVTSLFNESAQDFRLDPYTFQEFIVSVGYRLVRFHPLNELELAEPIESAIHVGLITLLTTLYIQIGSRRFLRYGLVEACLKRTINNGLEGRDADVTLWLLFLGGISVFGDIDRSWLVNQIKYTMGVLMISRWEDVHRHLVRFPWIRSLHGRPGRALWSFVVGTKKMGELLE